MPLNWRGKQVQRNVERAARLGVDATMQAAIKDAKKGHTAGSAARDTEGITGKVSGRRFQSRTGELERSIRVLQKARRDGRGLAGLWGAIGLAYARRIEQGFQGKDSAGRVFDQSAFPFLRPAANVEYVNLGRRIRSALRRGL